MQVHVHHCIGYVIIMTPRAHTSLGYKYRIERWGVSRCQTVDLCGGALASRLT